MFYLISLHKIDIPFFNRRLSMEKRVIQKANENTLLFKQHVLDQLKDHLPVEVYQRIESYEPTLLDRTDFVKRNRHKNTVPTEERCIAKSAKHDQCTRRRKPGHTCCGTHSKGVPHGLMSKNKTEQKELIVQDINGILYYLDETNVYKTEDVEQKKVDPTIIGTWSKVGDQYKIHYSRDT